jgi:hypothetical protein
MRRLTSFLFLFLLLPAALQAPTPAGNQLANPCFNGPHNGNPTGWSQTAGWDVSAIKNPCGTNGTSARINDPASSGESAPFRLERLWQVVPGKGGRLVAEIRCVQKVGLRADVLVYGGPTANGPWTLIWKPFTLASCTYGAWGPARHAEATRSAWPYYRVEMQAMYGAVMGGVKFTSAYFRSTP